MDENLQRVKNHLRTTSHIKIYIWTSYKSLITYLKNRYIQCSMIHVMMKFFTQSIQDTIIVQILNTLWNRTVWEKRSSVALLYCQNSWIKKLPCYYSRKPVETLCWYPLHDRRRTLLHYLFQNRWCYCRFHKP